MDLIAIVPVRAGSKGLPGKNLCKLAGVPLWERAVEQGRAAGASQVLVSTDAAEILAAPVTADMSVLKRPDALCRDETPMAPVLIHALQSLPGPARVVLLQATSPLRSTGDIRQAINLHETGRFDLVKTVTPTNPAVLKYGTMDGDRFEPMREPAFCFSNRQSLPPVMRPNGAAYVFDKDWFLENQGFVTDSIGAVVMPEGRSLDIDTEADFLRAEAELAS